MAEIDRAYTVRQVAEEYGVERDTVYRWIRTKQLAAIKLPGGDLRLRRHHLEAFDRCRDTSLPDQSTDSDSVEEPTSSTGPTKKVVTLEPFQRGRESVSKRKPGATNG